MARLESIADCIKLHEARIGFKHLKTLNYILIFKVYHYRLSDLTSSGALSVRQAWALCNFV